MLLVKLVIRQSVLLPLLSLVAPLVLSVTIHYSTTPLLLRILLLVRLMLSSRLMLSFQQTLLEQKHLVLLPLLFNLEQSLHLLEMLRFLRSSGSVKQLVDVGPTLAFHRQQPTLLASLD